MIRQWRRDFALARRAFIFAQLAPWPNSDQGLLPAMRQAYAIRYTAYLYYSLV